MLHDLEISKNLIAEKLELYKESKYGPGPDKETLDQHLYVLSQYRF